MKGAIYNWPGGLRACWETQAGSTECRVGGAPGEHQLGRASGRHRPRAGRAKVEFAT